MIKADTPNLWELRSAIGNIKTRAIIIMALTWLSKLVNVERNLNEIQIEEIINDVIEEYGYLKVEEVKYVLKQAIKAEKIFGRLDYNVVMGWFERYAAERIVHCVDISEQEATQERNNPHPSENAITFEDYLTRIRVLAENGDEEAKNRMKEYGEIANGQKYDPEASSIKDHEFKKWKTFNYLQNKK